MMALDSRLYGKAQVSPHRRAEYRGQNPRHMLLLQPPPLFEGEAASRRAKV